MYKPINSDNAYQLGRTNVLPQGAEQVYINFFLDFTNDTEYQLDFATVDQANQFGIPRSLFFDNLNNNQVVRVDVEGTNQTFEIPANSAGYYRINSPGKTRINFTAGATQAVKCSVALYNFDVVPIIWYKTGISNNSTVWGPDDVGTAPTHPPIFIGGVDPSGDIIALHLSAGGEVLFATTQLPATLGAKTGANSLSVVPCTDTPTLTKPAPVTISDYSISSMTGASETVLGAGLATEYVYIQSPASNAADIWLNLSGGTAVVGTGVLLQPGDNVTYNIAFLNEITGIAVNATDVLTVYAG